MLSVNPVKPTSRVSPLRAGRFCETYYDDGGLSGASLERPALQLLLTEVTEGRVDVIVVYKVDRLTRSLADFATVIAGLHDRLPGCRSRGSASSVARCVPHIHLHHQTNDLGELFKYPNGSLMARRYQSRAKPKKLV
jgi:hypothetical protein